MRNLLFLIPALAVLAAAPAARADFSGCIAGLKQAAIRSGVSPALAERALALKEPNEKVLELSAVQPEFKTPIWDYMAFLVDEERVRDGRALLQRHARVLAEAERRFGVDRHIVVAVWGVESNYGREMGEHFLPHALATLACAGGGRANFWRSELLAALALVQRGDFALERLRGSWAGAFGQTQFMPSVYRRLAVDFDGDGRRDLIASVPDALASTANYLGRAKWQTGAPWMIEVKVPPGYAGPQGRRNRLPLAAWAARGILRADGKPLGAGPPAGLLLPAGAAGPAFLVFANFDAIYAYNHAESYALAIAHLADRIQGLPGFRTPWPTDDPGLSRAERLQLQKLLIARGHLQGEADGKIGEQSRAAIRAAERALGWPETGRAGQKIFRALGGR
ncbi:MAG: lytic murein transglycosylase [Alphaproteobacteria bacterium]